jgi:tRNA threonylcarbamoyladenosine biosynthesis protein TsaB
MNEAPESIKKAAHVLALEFATAGGSMALVRDGVVACEREWTGEPSRRPETFADLQALLERSGADLGAVDLLAVGVGPGSFSGLRMAVSFLLGVALPDGKPVLAVSSAEALAFDVFREQPAAARVVVLGDARRGAVWAGVFERADGRIGRRGDWVVVPLERLPAELVAADSVWVTSDWDRLGAGLAEACPAGVRLIEAARRPRAAAVAELARRLAAAGQPGEPLVPIYLHPAVSGVAGGAERKREPRGELT